MDQTKKSKSRAVAGICLITALAAFAGFRYTVDEPRVNEERLAKFRMRGDFARGVNHAHIHRRGHGYGSLRSRSELEYLRRLGVNWITIMPYGYQNGAEGEEVVGYPGNPGSSEFFSVSDPTMTDRDIIDEVASARGLGMGVVIKPQIWSHDFWKGGKEWHGTIRQNSVAAHARWWESYVKFALHYAGVAKDAGADQFCIGTELVRMSTQYPEEWKSLIREIRLIYPGELSYAAHWDSEFADIGFWGELDYIGITAYFPLDAPDSADVETLVKAWEPHRDRIRETGRKNQKPIQFLEAGYRGITAPFRRPWESEGRSVDLKAQAVAYEALFEAFAEDRWLQGIFFWKTFTNPWMAYEQSDGSGYSFRNKPAEGVLIRWFGSSDVDTVD